MQSISSSNVSSQSATIERLVPIEARLCWSPACSRAHQSKHSSRHKAPSRRMPWGPVSVDCSLSTLETVAFFISRHVLKACAMAFEWSEIAYKQTRLTSSFMTVEITTCSVFWALRHRCISLVHVIQHKFHSLFQVCLAEAVQRNGKHIEGTGPASGFEISANLISCLVTRAVGIGKIWKDELIRLVKM